MDITKSQLERLLDDAGVSGRKRDRVLKGFDARMGASSTTKKPRAVGHGAPAPDTTTVNIL